MYINLKGCFRRSLSLKISLTKCINITSKIQIVIKMKLKRLLCIKTSTCEDMKHATDIIDATSISSVVGLIVALSCMKYSLSYLTFMPTQQYLNLLNVPGCK